MLGKGITGLRSETWAIVLYKIYLHKIAMKVININLIKVTFIKEHRNTLLRVGELTQNGNP